MTEKKILLSGIQPSGKLCIGNYIGALKKLNEKITETIVVANLMNDDDNSNSINEIIAKIHQLETESLDLIKKSDNTRP